MRNFTRDRDSNTNRKPVQTNRPAQPPVVQKNANPTVQPNPAVQPNRQPTFARPENRPNVSRPDQNVRRDDPVPPNSTRPNINRPGIDRTTNPRPGVDANAPNVRRPNPQSPTVAGPDAVRRDVNRPNIDRTRPGAPSKIEDQARPSGRNPAVDPTRDNVKRGGDRNRDAKGPNVVDRDRDKDRTRDPNRDRDRNVDRDRDGRRDVVDRDRDRDRDRNRDPNRNRANVRRYTSHYGNFGNRPDGYRDFVSRNFNVNRNVNNFQQNPWQYGHGNYWNQNYGNDWGQSNWYRNFNRYGYANNFSPWWGVVPGLGWNWGGWGWGWGWPQWGWGYGNWGGYGYGYGDYNTYYGNAGQPVQQITVIVPTPEAVQTAQDFYSDALAAFQDGRYQEAIRLCQHAMVDNPRSPDVILLMAQSLFAAGEYDQAADAVQMVVQLLPQDQWGTIAKNYANYYPNIEDYTTQLRALENASRTATQPDPALNMLLGYHYGFLGHPRQAVAELDTALDARPQDAGAQKLRDLFASSAGIPARTPAPAQQAPVAPPAPTADAAAGDQQVANRLTQAPSPEQTESATEFVATGEQAFKAGKYREAAQLWQHSLVDDPGNDAVLLLMAQSLFAQGRYADAAGATQMAMQLLPDNEWGNVIMKRNDIYGNPDEYSTQLKALEQARDAKPDDPALRFLLGFHYGAIGQSKQAIEELDKTIQLQPLDEGAKKLREVVSVAGTQGAQ